MKNFNYLISGIFVLILFSCSSTSELGTKVDKFFQSNRYKVTVKERDSLIAVNRQLQSDTIRMTRLIESLQKEYKKLNEQYYLLGSKDSALNKEYTALKNEQIKMKADYKYYSDSLEKKLSLLTEELKVKSDEISNNEKLLNGDKALIARRDSVARELDNTVRNALSGYNPDELSTGMRGGKIYVSVSDNLLFKSGSTTVGDMGRKVLKKLSRVINQYQDINVSIEGNAGNKPVDLTAARAKAITAILSEEYDVDPTKLTSSGKGEFLRVSSNENVEGRAKRTDIILSPGLDDLSKSKDKK